MDFDELNRILEIVREHELSEFELERDGFRIKIKKGSLVQPSYPVAVAVPMPPAASHLAAAGAAPGPQTRAGETVEGAAAAKEEIDLAVVKSPIVGTFFRAAEPG